MTTPKLYRFRGASLSVADVAALTGDHPNTVRNRISGNRIMEAEEAKAASAAFRDPPIHARLYTVAGRTHCLADWARLTGLPYATLKTRIRRGWRIERALSERPASCGRGALTARNRRLIRRIVSSFAEARP